MGNKSPSRNDAHRKLIKKIKAAERDGGWFCCYCKKELMKLTKENYRDVDTNADNYPTLEHIEPLAYGGKRRKLENLTLACRECNNITHNKPLNDRIEQKLNGTYVHNEGRKKGRSKKQQQTLQDGSHYCQCKGRFISVGLCSRCAF